MCPVGGWEACLSSPPEDDVTCVICYDLMVEPRTACTNGHSACSECYDAHFASPSGSKCPSGCGELIQRGNLTPVQGIEEKIAGLESRCKHARGPGEAAAEGEHCTWTGSFGSLLEHLQKVCPFETVECPYAQLGCTEPIRRRDLEAHLSASALRHMELAGSTIASLSSTVATLSGTVHTLQEQVGLSRMQLSGAVPRLLELELNPSIDSAVTLPDETRAFLGLYKLDEGTRVNEMPLWVHCEDGRRCIAFNREHSFWHAQRRSEAGEARGFVYRRSGGGAAPSPHPTDSPWLAYTGNAFTGEHSWLEDGVRCVVWEAAERPRPTTSVFATKLTLGGSLPPGMHTGARRCMGDYRRRDERGDGCELSNGRHTYVKVDDPAMMLWFARWPHEATADQYTGWYVGNKSDLGHCRGFLMTPSVDVALRPTRMPRLWKVGRAGPGSGYEDAPGIVCKVPGHMSPGTGATAREVEDPPEAADGAGGGGAGGANSGRGRGCVGGDAGGGPVPEGGARTRSGAGGGGGSSAAVGPSAVGSKRRR